MNAKRVLLSSLTLLVAMGSLVGCGGSGSSGATGKAKFCQDNNTIDKAAVAAGAPGVAPTPDQLLQVFKANQATINDFGKTAPSDIKTDAQFLVDKVNAAIKANSLAGQPDLTAAGHRVDLYCGQNADGTPIGSTNTFSTKAPPTTVKSIQLQWSTPQQLEAGQAADVSCSTESFCAALVVAAQSGVSSAVIWDGTAWSAPKVLLNQELNHVSCHSTSFCLAGAPIGASFTWDGTSWSSGSSIRWPNPQDGITTLSCGSKSFCVAGDEDGDMRIWDGTSWSIEHKAGGHSVSCPTTSFCMTIDQGNNVSVWDGTSFSTPQPIDAGNNNASVSCPTTSFCMALDQSGRSLVWNGTTWSAPQETQPNSHCTSNCTPSALNWVSCPTTSFCEAIGTDGTAITWNGTLWSAPQPVDPNLATNRPQGLGTGAVSCPTPSLCVAVFPDGNAVIGRRGG